MYKTYEHHGNVVHVRADLKGKHREYCLCWSCNLFAPEYPKYNCPIANLVFSVCVLANLVLPVWECPRFKAKI